MMIIQQRTFLSDKYIPNATEGWKHVCVVFRNQKYKKILIGFLLQIDAFMDSQSDLGVANRAFIQARETAQNNIKYLQTNLQTLTEWLSTASP